MKQKDSIVNTVSSNIDDLLVKPTINEVILDSKGNALKNIKGIIDLRDHDVIDIIEMITKGLRDERHRGKDKVRLPVGWVLISTEEYDKRMKPSWWVGTQYETPILLGKALVVCIIMLTIPYVALTRIENIPDEWRIVAKNKQSSTGG